MPGCCHGGSGSYRVVGIAWQRPAWMTPLPASDGLDHQSQGSSCRNYSEPVPAKLRQECNLDTAINRRLSGRLVGHGQHSWRNLVHEVMR
jgi:hypothetical protein